LGLSHDEFMALGRVNPGDSSESFCMTVLALKKSRRTNGVSAIHADVSRLMWHPLWPERPEIEVPIGHITNGVHVLSWLAPQMHKLLETRLSQDWSTRMVHPDVWEKIDEIDDGELWETHQSLKMSLIRFVRRRLLLQAKRLGHRKIVQQIMQILDPDVLTIGCARRFATYKRGDLILAQLERLEKLIGDARRPIQIVFAGKAHPKDNEGKGIIRSLVDFGLRTNLRHRFIFLEDYDMHIARCLVQGADVWLNTPRRPMEACGTSGMKAALNGVLNVSILDGWWCEGYSPERGWRIGNGEEYQDHSYQDAVESQAVYNIIENEVAPLYYERAAGGIPRAWLKMMKASMKMAMSQFCSLRMISEYEERFYLPASRRFEELVSDGGVEALRLSDQHRRYLDKWPQIQVAVPVRSAQGPFRVNQSFEVTTVVQTGDLRPDELNVELYYGKMRHLDRIDEPRVKMMRVKEEREAATYLYSCKLPCTDSGRYGFTVRVTPNADAWIQYRPELLTWA